MTHADVPTKPPRYLVVINNLSFFYSHFWNLAIAIRRAGWDVYIAGNENVSSSRLVDGGMSYISLPPVGGIRSFTAAFRYFFALRRELQWLRPDVCHFIYLESVLFGGIAARSLDLPAVVGAVTGLGTLFAEDRLIYRIARRMVVVGIRWGYKNRRAVLAFENLDDRGYFVIRHAVREHNTVIIPGAGVEADELNPAMSQADSTGQEKRPVVLFASRMIRSKGVIDLVRAAKDLNNRSIHFDLWLAGDFDRNNPTSLRQDEIEEFRKLPFLQYLGHRSDMARLMLAADIFCLPTYYREGLPRVIIEACAAGKPVITTNVPGCRDIIRNGVNGFVVEPRDHDALVGSLTTLLSDAALCLRMGIEGRRIFEETYTLESVLMAFDKCYRTLSVPLGIANKQSEYPSL